MSATVEAESDESCLSCEFPNVGDGFDPTDPTNHPADRLALSKIARGQKGTDQPDDPACAPIPIGTGDHRISGDSRRPACPLGEVIAA